MTPFSFCSPPPRHFCFQKHASVLPPRVHGLRQPRAIFTHPRTRVGELEEKTIREKLLNAEQPQPSSSYDTAWVAMVPAPGCPQASRFPQSVEWILQNQRGDGSWGLDDGHPSLVKDALSSTLACVLALETWGVGDEHARKGLCFIGHNLPSVMDDDDCDKPVGFNVIFSGMLARCMDMGLEMPLSQSDIDAIFRRRDKELESMASGSKAFRAYVAEGLGNLVDWNEMMPYQRRNGSFFNSPATTAAAAIHTYNGRALQYLDSLISLFGSSVPTVYPRNLYTQLRMVDTLEKTGISWRFSSEINYILDKTYTSWQANDEEIMLDTTACAMAFRLLRMHGYDISSDVLAQFIEESSFHDSIHGSLNDTEALLELHKASQVQIMEEEIILENIGLWSAKLLKQQLRSNRVSTRTVHPAEVEHVLKHPFYTTIDRLEHKRNIENFMATGIQMLKSAYRACFPDEEITSLAAADFQSAQTAYQEELQGLESWVKELRLDELEFARVMPLTCSYIAVGFIFPCELSEARIAISKNCILTTLVDDLFDFAGSREEMENLVKLIEMWHAHDKVGFCSERVETVFRAIYDTNNQLGAKAAAVQNRSVINHIAELWADLVKAMMAEANWATRRHIPSFEEYMAVGELSIGLPLVIPTSLYLYSIAPGLPDDVVTSQEYKQMFRHMNVCGRLLNDLQSYEREKKEGKINSVRLLAQQMGSIEAAKREVRSTIEASRIQLLRLVLRNESVVPGPFRQVLWNACKLGHHIYGEVDGYGSANMMMHAGNALVHDPLRIPLKTDSPATSST